MSCPKPDTDACLDATCCGTCLRCPHCGHPDSAHPAGCCPCTDLPTDDPWETR